MARRRRIPRLIANPVTTVLLSSALIADLATLPGDPWSPTHSVAGVWYQSMRSPPQPTPMWVQAIVFKDARGLRLRDMGKEPSWGDVATIMSGRPADAAILSGPEEIWRGRGVWAITTMTRRLHIDAQFGSGFNAFERQEARDLYLNEIVSPEWAESPRLLERLRREDFTVTEVVWGGVLHNALALAGVVLFLMSLAWVPRTRGYLRERRGRRRMRRGLCPRCAYPIAGLAVCPECGASLPVPVSGADAVGVA